MRIWVFGREPSTAAGAKSGSRRLPKTGQRYHHADLRFIYSVHTGADRRKVTAMEEYTDDKWITRQELADRYGVPVKTPAEWASKGTGP